jgi:hypothetical protein
MRSDFGALEHLKRGVFRAGPLYRLAQLLHLPLLHLPLLHLPGEKSGMSTWACMNLAFGSTTPGRGCGGRGSRCRGRPGSPARGTGTSMLMPAPSVTMTRMGCRCRRRLPRCRHPRRRLIRQRPGPHRPLVRRPRQRLRRLRSPGPRRRGRLHPRRLGPNARLNPRFRNGGAIANR